MKLLWLWFVWTIVTQRVMCAWVKARMGHFPGAVLIAKPGDPSDNYLAAMVSPSWLLLHSPADRPFAGANEFRSGIPYHAYAGLLEFDGNMSSPTGQEREITEKYEQKVDTEIAFYCAVLLRTASPFEERANQVTRASLLFAPTPRPFPTSPVPSSSWPAGHQEICLALQWQSTKTKSVRLVYFQLTIQPSGSCRLPWDGNLTLCTSQPKGSILCDSLPAGALIFCQRAAAAFFNSYDALWINIKRERYQRKERSSLTEMIPHIGTLHYWVFLYLLRFFKMAPECSVDEEKPLLPVGLFQRWILLTMCGTDDVVELAEMDFPDSALFALSGQGRVTPTTPCRLYAGALFIYLYATAIYFIFNEIFYVFRNL